MWNNLQLGIILLNHGINEVRKCKLQTEISTFYINLISNNWSNATSKGKLNWKPCTNVSFTDMYVQAINITKMLWIVSEKEKPFQTATWKSSHRHTTL